MLLAAVLLFGVLGVGVGLLTVNRGGAPKVNSSTPTIGSQQEERRGERNHAKRPTYDGPSSEQIGADAREEDGLSTSGSSEEPDVGDQTQLATLRIVCVSGEGVPVPGVRVRCLISKDDPATRRDAEQVRRVERVTDEEGSIEIVSHPDHWAHMIEVISEKWYARPIDSGNAVSFSQSDPVTIILSPASTVRIRAVYEDGEPVNCAAHLMRPAIPPEEIASSGQQVRDSWTFVFSKDGVAVVEGVATDEDMMCIVFCGDRVGYDRHSAVITAPELQSGGEIQIIIPRSLRPYGAIRVEFTNGPTGSGGTILVESDRAGPISRQYFANQSTIEIWPLWAAEPARYRVTLQPNVPPFRVPGAELRAYRSDWVEVRAHETTKISAAHEICGTVRARLIDRSANPIKGGVLRLSNGDYLKFVAGERRGVFTPRVPQRMQSDDDGNVVLEGLPPGRLEIEADAWGRQPVLKEVLVRPGEAHDLGTIVLAEAEGQITVMLTNMREDYEYVVWLGSAVDGGTVRPWKPVEGDTAKIEQVPLREWTIGCTLKQGGRVVTERVTLSAERPAATIVLDVTTVEP
jgi:hypothetical protein